MIFYDYEVFAYDWLVVAIDPDKHKVIKIANDRDKLQELHNEYANDIWVGFNNAHYDQYIHKAILLGMNPKTVSDWIIAQGHDGWQYSTLFRQVRMINYDVMLGSGRIGLKTIEAYLGTNIKETEVDFNITRKLTPEEIEQTFIYCTNDVTMTIQTFLQTLDVWHAMSGIVKAFPDMVSWVNIGDSEAQLAAKVLGCHRSTYEDEFAWGVLPCVRLNKYKYVQDWFMELRREAESKDLAHANEYEKKAWYKSKSLDVMIAGVPHTFGFGGLHGAIDHPVHLTCKDGAGYHVDVNNYYPSMLNAWGLVTRSATNDNYMLVYNTRKALKKKQQAAKDKAEKKKYKKMQLPYKKILNALSGAMKDKANPAYDPRNNNIMCINGQLMLLDLIEHLEVIPGFKLVQSNTDGLIVWIPDTDDAFEQMDDICFEWESRCSTSRCDIKLAFDIVTTIYQKDVNNYLFTQDDGAVERIGRYLKPLSPIDYDLPILNEALVEYMVHGTPVEQTINNCNDLIKFEKVVKLSSKYDHVEHEHCKPVIETKGVRVIKQVYQYPVTVRYKYKCYRVFASTDVCDGRLLKVRDNGKAEKFGGTPDHCFILNDDLTGVPIPKNLDRTWYIDQMHRIMTMFGITGGETHG